MSSVHHRDHEECIAHDTVGFITLWICQHVRGIVRYNRTIDTTCRLFQTRRLRKMNITVGCAPPMETEEFITSGNCKGKYNSLSHGASSDQPDMPKRRPSRMELPHYDEHYAPTLPRICYQDLSCQPPWSLGLGLLIR